MQSTAPAEVTESLRRELEDTFSSHYSMFIGLAVNNLPRHIQHEAEDIVQDAFVSACEQLHLYRREATVRSWISVMVIRTAWKRAKQHERSAGSESLATAAENPTVHAKVEACEILAKLMSGLSEKQRGFLGKWMAGELDEETDNVSNRNLLRRTTNRMRAIAKRKGLAR